MNKENNDTDPSITYKKPADLLRADDISKEEKIKLLRDWEYTLRQMQVAEEENMSSGPDASLQDVLDALHELGAESLDTGISKT